MNDNSIYLLLFVVLLSFFAIIGLLLSSVLDKTAQQGQQRIKHLAQENSPQVSISLIRQKYLTTLSPFEQQLEALPYMMRLGRLIEHSGRFFPAYRLVLFSLMVSLLVGIGLWFYSANAWAVLLVIVFILWLPIALLKQIKNSRLAKFEEQLPDALDMMARAMRAGHRFNDTLQLVAKELPNPISAEFGITFDELNYGVDARLAFNNLLSRIPSVSLMTMVTAVLVQKDSGGNLAEMLQNISVVVRNRFKFQRKVKTLTAEGRMSAWVLALMPVGLFVLLEISNPDYVNQLFTNPLGIKLMMAGLGLMAIGGLWVGQLLKIKV